MGPRPAWKAGVHGKAFHGSGRITKNAHQRRGLRRCLGDQSARRVGALTTAFAFRKRQKSYARGHAGWPGNRGAERLEGNNAYGPAAARHILFPVLIRAPLYPDFDAPVDGAARSFGVACNRSQLAEASGRNFDALHIFETCGAERLGHGFGA